MHLATSKKSQKCQADLQHSVSSYNFTNGHYIKQIADNLKLLVACKFHVANCFVLGAVGADE